MLFRAEPQVLKVFNAQNGRMGSFSEGELERLKKYVLDGEENLFVKRLRELRLLPNRQNQYEVERCLAHLAQIGTCKGIEGASRVPEALHIDVTTRCPLKCPQCYKLYGNEVDLPIEALKVLVDEARQIGVFQIAIGGGEPLLYEKLEEGIDYITTQGLACTLTTSGYKMDLTVVEKLINAGLNHLQISLNGSSEAINQLSRDGYGYAIEAMKALKKYGNNVSWGINWVARKDNIHDLESLLSLIHFYGAGNINILRYKPTMGEDYDEIALEEKDYERLMDTIRRIRGITVCMDSAFSFLLCKLYAYQTESIVAGCGAGRNFMVVDPMGRFKPCSHRKEISSGGQSILDYWTNDKDLKKIRGLKERSNSKCTTCLYLSRCRGCQVIEDREKNKMCMAYSKGEKNDV